MLESSIRDDVIRCKFVRNRETRVQGRLYDLSTQPYNLLLAAGSQITGKVKRKKKRFGFDPEVGF